MEGINHKLKAGVYCRVSTQLEIQEGSLAWQRQHYFELLSNDPNIESVQVYCDEGFSGKYADRRPGFQQMLKDCEAGKIDVLYAKSISRFSRNLADCIPNDSTVIPSYYVEDNHVPIVDRHTFRQVQRIMELKSPHGEYCRYPYVDTNFVCPLCGKKLIPQIMHTQVQKRALCCFGEDGCQGYSIKTYLVDAALLEAYNTLRLPECAVSPEEKTAERKRMEEIKAESPTMTSVHYYWLDDLVERVEFIGSTLRVFWKCGLVNEAQMNIPANEEPTHVAELYRRFLTRLMTGEYRPAKPKSVTERVLAESHMPGTTEAEASSCKEQKTILI